MAVKYDLKTEFLKIPLPNPQNSIYKDCERLIQALTIIDAKLKTINEILDQEETGDQQFGCVREYDGFLDLDNPDTELVDSMPVGGLVSFDCPFEPESVYLGGVPNSREIITESGEWTAPVSGYYGILAINGGQGASLTTDGFLYGGRSGAYKKATAWFDKGEVVPITIGAGGVATTVYPPPDTINGGITTAGDVDFSDYNTCFLSGGGSRRVANTVSVSSFGGGFGGRFINEGVWYGAGGGGYYSAQTTATPEVHDGANGAVILIWYDPAKDPRATIDTASSVSVTDLAAQLAALKAQVEELKNG